MQNGWPVCQMVDLFTPNFENNGVMITIGSFAEEFADVVIYMMNSWGNRQDKMLTPSEV